MAAKRLPRPTLAPEQLDAAEVLYLARIARHLSPGALSRWVADQLYPPCHWRSVQAAAQRLGWELERLRREDARKARAKPDAARQVEIEAEQDERHAALAARELDLRARLIEKAHEAVQGMTPKEAVRALRSVGTSKDGQFVERLARGRTTDKTEVDDETKTRREAFWKALHGRLAERDQSGGPPGTPGRDVPVRPVEAEHVATEGGG